MIRTIALVISWFFAVPAFAEFKPVVERRSGNWSAVLYRNTNSDRLFCALESYDRGTAFRIVRYKDGEDTFLEIVNDSWKLITGRTQFTLAVVTNINQKELKLNMEITGTRERVGYSHSFEEFENYSRLFAIIANLKSLAIINSNKVNIASFASQGAKPAAHNYVDCVMSDWEKALEKAKNSDPKKIANFHLPHAGDGAVPLLLGNVSTLHLPQ